MVSSSFAVRAWPHQPRHEHGPPLLSRAASVIYYPQQESSGPANARFYDGGSAVEVAPQSGRVVLFPTDLLHEVDPVWAGGPRRDDMG